MRKSWQWLIGMGVVLVVAALVIASLAPFVLSRLGLAAAMPFAGPMSRFGPNMPMRPGFLFGLGRMGGRMPFMGLFGLAGCLWPLLIAGLIIYGIILLGRRPAQPVMMGQMPLPMAPTTGMPPAAPTAPVAAAQASCPTCGQPLQPGWRHCPNCGVPLAA